MVSVDEIKRTIDELKSRETSFSNCAKLADLYIVHDHLTIPNEPNHSGRVAEKIEIGGNSDFLKMVQSTDANLVWGVLDELMSVLKVSNPRLYEGVMQKLRQ